MVNRASDFRYSGNVTDSVEFQNGSIVVSINCSGSWWADQNGNTLCLTNSIDNPDMFSIERGPEGENHLYASSTTLLLENRDAALSNWQTIPLLFGANIVKDITILIGARKIIIGCNNGIFWSEIPLPLAMS